MTKSLFKKINKAPKRLGRGELLSQSILPANGSAAGPPRALGRPGPRFLRQGLPGRRKAGQGRPPGQTRAQGAGRERSENKLQTAGRPQQGSLRSARPRQPRALSRRSPGSQRRQTAEGLGAAEALGDAAPKVPRALRLSPVPRWVRVPPSRAGSAAALPVPALPLAESRLARPGLAGARQDSEGKADAGRPPGRRSWPGRTRSFSRASPVGKSRWSRQEAAATLLAELRQGHPWVFLGFFFVCLLVQDLGWIFFSYWLSELIATRAGDGRSCLELSTDGKRQLCVPGPGAPCQTPARGQPRPSGLAWPRPADQGETRRDE